MSSPAPPDSAASDSADPDPAAPARRGPVLVAGLAAALVLVAAVAFVAGSVSRSAEPSTAGSSAGHAAGHAAGQGAAGQGAAGQGTAGQGGHHGEGVGALELYAVQTGELGTVVTTGDGRLLYGSERDASAPSVSRCTGPCAQQWLPVVVPAGQQPDLLGVDAAAVGRVTRDDGSSQLTLGGWPVYVNRADDGGLKTPVADGSGWFALSPQGAKVPV